VIRLLLSFLRPLATIAQELHILRQLYEMELAARDPPLYRVTEQPNPSNTEVMYGTSDPPKQKKWPWSEDVIEEVEQ
jgi:hypothetical protein